MSFHKTNIKPKKLEDDDSMLIDNTVHKPVPLGPLDPLKYPIKNCTELVQKDSVKPTDQHGCSTKGIVLKVLLIIS